MESPGELDNALRELGTFVREEIATTQVAIGCLRAVAARTMTEIEQSGDPARVYLIDTELEGFTFVPRIDGLEGALSLRREVSEGGMTHARLTQQLVVTLFTAWEEHHRERIARARDISPDALKVPYFGDLRLLRMDIVHHMGLAKNSVRCVEAVKTRHLSMGDLVFLADDELMQLMSRMPWGELMGRPKN